MVPFGVPLCKAVRFQGFYFLLVVTMKILKTTVVVFLVAIFVGAAYQWLTERADRALIPGDLIDVDGHQLHLLCQGEGSPLVLLENGLWGSYPDWQYVLDAVGKHTRVCAYDRLGLGWSSENNTPTRSAEVARQLHRLLAVAELDEAMILVGFSAGGLYVREYFQRYPEKVVAMVLLDSSHEQQAQRIAAMDQDLSLERFCAAVSWTGMGRVFNLMAPFVEPSFGPQLYAEQMRVYNRSGFCKGLLLQSEGFDADLLAGRKPESLGALPLVVIRAGKSIRDQVIDEDAPEEFLAAYELSWPQLQQELAALSSQSRLLVAEDSGHAIQLQQPGIVIATINKLVDTYRDGGL